jgi:transcriptional regulator with XRE-family HTH domain
MESIRVKLGKRVRTLRKARGWSQQELADHAVLHPTYIGGIERGERNVSLMNLAKLSEAFRVSMAELLHFSSEGQGEENLRELIAGGDELGLAFFATFCQKCESLKRFRELRALSPSSHEQSS